MNALIPSISVPGLLAERQARIDAANAVLNNPHTVEFADFLNRGRIRHRENALAEYIQHEERRCWRLFIQASGLWDLFPRAKREEWMQALGMGEWEYRAQQTCPEFTVEAAHATFTAYVEQRGELRRDALLDLFRRLSWDHATNQPALFGMKLIYRGLADRWGNLDVRSFHLLDDLLRELYRLDSKPEPVGSWKQNDNATGYFHVQTFKNGNGHIILERADLVDKLNAELARYCPGVLPAASKVKRRA